MRSDLERSRLCSISRAAARVLCVLASCLLVLVGDALAQIEESTRNVSKTGTTAAAFLSIPVGARHSAMGGATSAVADDATSIYWNPAGLADLENGSLTVEYADWLVGISFNYVAVALPTDIGTFGLGVTSMRTPSMDVTTEDQPDGTGEEFNASSHAFALSYGRALTDRFRIGGTAKLISEKISNSSASGIALDVGTVFTTPFRGIRLGAAITNYGTKMRMSGDDLLVPIDIAPNVGGNNESTRGEITTDDFDLPLVMRIGLAGEIYETENSRLTLAIDALNPNDNSQYVNLGAEAAFLGGLVMIRAGYSELFLDESVRSFTAGAGLNSGFGNLHFLLDYAYEAHTYFDGVNRFTFSLQF